MGFGIVEEFDVFGDFPIMVQNPASLAPKRLALEIDDKSLGMVMILDVPGQ